MSGKLKTLRSRCLNRYTLIAVISLGLASWVWTRHIRPTRVAVVNFSDMYYAQYLDAKDNPFVRIHRIKAEDLVTADLSSYSATLIFGMGLRLTEEQLAAMRGEMKNGARVFTLAHTNKESDLTNIAGKDLDYFNDYTQNGGRKNTQRLLNYVRRAMDGKKLFSDPVADADIIPMDSMFHLAKETFFETAAAYQKYYEKEGLYKEGRPRVCMLTSIIGPRTTNRSFVDGLIERLEARNLNVYPVAGFLNRLEYLKEVNPDIVVYIPHGRLAMGQPDASVAWLKEQNVPLLCPLDVNQPHDEWLDDQQGLMGGMLSQSIVVPEIDGCTEPFVIGARFPDERGLYVSGPISKRLDRLATRVENWLTLKSKPNKDKRVAIVYYKGPGRNAMVAAGLEVAPSLLGLLRHLKSAGFDTGPLPESDEAFWERIQREGPVLGPYAKGTFDAFVKTGNPELISVTDYLDWVSAQLDPELYANVEAIYGPAPGDYLSLAREGRAYIALPRVTFGNVVLLPQLMPGIGDDTNRLVHGVKTAPPHPYIASYLWASHGFKADAIVHFGTHGSFEFTPWKQSALSRFDWADALIGELPHPYIYVINNIGEAIIAKRRSYATIVSHLTPAFVESELYGPLIALDQAVDGYKNTDDDTMRAEYAADISAGVVKLKLNKDLGFDDFKAGNRPSAEMVHALHNYLHTIAQEKITSGLYALGTPYNAAEARETARLMAVDAISYSLAKLDKAKAEVDPAKRATRHDFSDSYRKNAFSMIEQIFEGSAVVEDFLDPADLERLSAWDDTHNKDDAAAMMAAIAAMSKKKKESEAEEGDCDLQRIRELFLIVAADEKRLKFLKGLKNDARFKKTEVVLDPDKMESAKQMARFIPSMREAMEIMEMPETGEILTAMHRCEATKKEVLGFLEDPKILEDLRAEQAKERAARVDTALGDTHKNVLFQTSDTAKLRERAGAWSKAEGTAFLDVLAFFTDNITLTDEIEARGTDDAKAMAALLRLGKAHLEVASKIVRKRLDAIEQKESDYVEAVRAVRDTLGDVKEYETALLTSTNAELQSAVQTLSGGYLSPSSGGDPIGNPASVPTGRNLFSINMEKCPSPQAWRVGVDIAESIIENKRKETGDYPKKVAITLWGGELIRSEGVELATIFHLLGVAPERNSRGVVHAVRLVPMEALQRPRIDVVVQTSGQARDIAASRLFLIDEAVKLASGADDPPDAVNRVKEGTLMAERTMKERGLSPLDARTFATARVFGGVNGTYGTAIMGMVEDGDRWKSDKEISDQYLKNMGAVYTKEHWGHYGPGIFEGALQNTDTIAHGRSSNMTGPLSLDHVYEFMGGLSATIRNVTGSDPNGYFADLRNRHNPTIQGLKEAIWTESRTTLMNPKYITALQEGGASSAEVFAETFRNTYGWNVMKPAAIDNALWEGLYDVYVEDSHNLNMEAYFKQKNPYALQEMTAVMLETVRKGYWKADENIIERLAGLHAELVRDHSAGCSGFVCDNAELREMITKQLPEKLRKQYNDAIDQTRIGETRKKVQGMTLEKEEKFFDRVEQIVRDTPGTIVLLLGLIGLLTAVVIFGARRV